MHIFLLTEFHLTIQISNCLWQFALISFIHGKVLGFNDELISMWIRGCYKSRGQIETLVCFKHYYAFHFYTLASLCLYFCSIAFSWCLTWLSCSWLYQTESLSRCLGCYFIAAWFYRHKKNWHATLVVEDEIGYDYKRTGKIWLIWFSYSIRRLHL